jgi:hypothetical protein
VVVRSRTVVLCFVLRPVIFSEYVALMEELGIEMDFE